MGRTITETERLLAYAMTAGEKQLQEAREIFATALRSRFGATEKKGKKAAKKKVVEDGKEPQQ